MGRGKKTASPPTCPPMEACRICDRPVYLQIGEFGSKDTSETPAAPSFTSTSTMASSHEPLVRLMPRGGHYATIGLGTRWSRHGLQ